jgi:hypothetical protein
VTMSVPPGAQVRLSTSAEPMGFGMTSATASLMWGVGTLPGETPEKRILMAENPPEIPVDESVYVGEEPSDSQINVTGIREKTTEKITPVSGDHGKSAALYFKGSLGATTGAAPAILGSSGAGSRLASSVAEDIAVGYGFISAGGGPNFSKLILTEALPGGQDTFELFSGGKSYGMVSVGTEFDFSTIAADGVSNFALMGINPDEQLSPTAAFPMTVGLQFAADGVLDLHAITYSPVPEPSTLILLTLGAIGMFVAAWKKRK